MRVLVLGGTVFLGRHVVECALARGDEVTIVHRGITGRELFEGAVERILADRDGGLAALRGRRFDAVIDTSGYEPHVVAHALDVLAGGADRYVFVSTGNVYADHSRPGIREDAPLIAFSDELDGPARYGGAKAACERLVRERFGELCLIARSGLIVGPNDPTGRFSWWVDRIARGGRTLAPEPRTQPVQVVDVRDLAAFLMRGADGSAAGTLNVAGPRDPIDLAGLLVTLCAALGSDASLEWRDEQRLLAAGVEPWSELPLWLAPTHDPAFACFMAAEIARAIDAGLLLRPLAETTRDTLAWLRAGNPLVADGRPPVGLTPERERALRDR